MTTLPQDEVADLSRLVAELEQRLDSSFVVYDQAIARQAALGQENARLQSELATAQEREAASAEILRTISETSGDAERSLPQIAEITARLFGASSVRIRLVENGEWGRSFHVGRSSDAIQSAVPAAKARIGGRNLPGTVVAENRQIHVPDLDHIDPAIADWPGLPVARAAGARTISGTPMRREGKAIGVFTIHRDTLLPFTGAELALQQSFADQATIAVENARLFNESREALARQTATADVLRVISQSPTDVQPVFDAIVQTAVRLLGCDVAVLLLRDGAAFSPAAEATPEGLTANSTARNVPIDPDANFPSRVIVEKKMLHLPDWSRVELPEHERRIQATIGVHSALLLPLLREHECIGVLTLTGKQPRTFSESEIALAESYCDQALIAIENVRLFNETREALERQTATADILKVIASSPSDVQPVFDAIATSANRLIGGFSTTVFRFIDGIMHLKSFTPTSPAGDEVLQAMFPRPLDQFPIFLLVRDGQTAEFTDTETESEVPSTIRDLARSRGFRSMLFMPLMSNGASIGMIGITRTEPGAFAANHIQLLQTFADQAVIAIENVRLFDEVQARTNDLSESLQQQTATADVLKVISRSAFDLQTVLETLTHSAVELSGAIRGAIFLRDGDVFRFKAASSHLYPEWIQFLRDHPQKAGRNSAIARSISSGQPVCVPDVLADPEIDLPATTLAGIRAVLAVPLLRDGNVEGVMVLSRPTPGPFNERQVELVQTFADQAVIAIENVRLFDEVQARTSDLSESLQQQTATADVLKVISRSVFDLQTVLDTLVESAYRLCGAELGLLYLRGDEAFECKAIAGDGVAEANQLFKGRPIRAGRGTAAERVILTGEVHGITDFDEDPEFDPKVRDFLHKASEAGSDAGRLRSTLAVPMTRDSAVVGVMVIARSQTGPFPARQIELLQTFADQAVIAIENARLFDEVQARTNDLSESLQQQTATADVLKVISRSAFDLDTVMNTLTRSASDLCGADMSGLFLREGDVLLARGVSDIDERLSEMVRHTPVRINEQTHMGRSVLTGDIINLADVTDGELDTRLLSFQKAFGYKSLLVVPLLREGRGIGVFALCSNRVGAFSQRQIELVQTFADQAVIAIENVRLFDEVQAKTADLSEALQQQTATADVLKVISRSTFDLQTVLETLIKSAVELSGANRGSIFLREGDVFPLKAASSTTPEFLQYWAANPPKAGRGSATERVIASGKVEIIPDVLEDPEMQMTSSSLARIRAALGVPMLRDNKVEGVLVLTRPEPGPFSRSQIDLVQTFADQAVIAVENVRLFDETQARTKELAASLEELRAAQDRLVQTEKLASLGQLTAGIAHEIKNPLNFVNNFSSLSAELTDELNDVLKTASLADKVREEVDELTGLLKDNLQKVVQHGKRADSIVKNMLLHSREGSGDHRPTDINALLDESLNLAYHGARAEKPQFNVTLQRDYDAGAGMIEVFPQEITRVFLNLIGNGFYAVTKRKADAAESFEATVRATTKNLGDRVEIRIRDNGTGIPPEVEEKMFNPFFTTKPAGEGTGLGLSMSHDIIVKQHGGSIDVETEPGQFTEFTVVLPRASHSSNRK
jgi:GAF domain-containing protein